ncbi:NAD-dependent epimerase/dehydratase family protein [Lysobacter terrae]
MRILITGATGLVGQGVLQECLQASDVESVTALLRHPTGRSDPRLREVLVADFAALDGVEDELRGLDACFYCAGAPPIGTPEAQYRHVTLDLTLNVARTLARLNPSLRLLYISGAHSDPSSHLMPLRVKGETEQALGALPLRTTMLRTGGIQPVHGEHSPHKALDVFYRIGGPVMGLGVAMAPALFTTTAHVGRAMLALARMPDPPRIVENGEINRLGA